MLGIADESLLAWSPQPRSRKRLHDKVKNSGSLSIFNAPFTLSRSTCGIAQVKVPSQVKLQQSAAHHGEEIKVPISVRCSSCGQMSPSTTFHEIHYKTIIAHFEQVSKLETTLLTQGEITCPQSKPIKRKGRRWELSWISELSRPVKANISWMMHDVNQSSCLLGTWADHKHCVALTIPVQVIDLVSCDPAHCSGVVEWPPCSEVLEAAGGVGFGNIQKEKWADPSSIAAEDVMVPPVIRTLHPKLAAEGYARHRRDPLFMYKVRVDIYFGGHRLAADQHRRSKVSAGHQKLVRKVARQGVVAFRIPIPPSEHRV